MADLKEKLETAMGDYIYQTYICKKMSLLVEMQQCIKCDELKCISFECLH